MDASTSGLNLVQTRDANNRPKQKKRTGTSKYDFIKVKVWLGKDMDHYYILSRFLICRMLTVTKIPYIKAVKIALETKKYLVDNNLHDVTQAQLESVLFSIIRSKGFDDAYIDCYRMVTRFYQSRQPLCIIICGTAWTGKSTIAQQLASRINIPNVMQTDVIYELLRADPETPLHQVPLWARQGLAGGRCCDAALVGEFRREARVVRKGMEGDLIKTLSDGKPIIIEGLHLDPGLYIPDFSRSGLIMLPARPSPAAAAAAVAAVQAAAAAGRSPGSSPVARRGKYGRSITLPRVAAPTAAATAVGPVSRLSDVAGACDGDSAAWGGAGAACADSGQQQQEEEQQPQQHWEEQQEQPLGGLLRVQQRSASAAAEVSVSARGPLKPEELEAPNSTARVAVASAGQHALQEVPATRQQQQLGRQLLQRQLRAEWQEGPAQQEQQQQPRSNKPTSETCGGASSSKCTISPHCLQLGASCTAGSTSDICKSPGTVASLVQQKKIRDSPFAATAAAAATAATDDVARAPETNVATEAEVAAAAAAAADAGTGAVSQSGPSSLLGSPSVVVINDLQVSAAAAEAAALQQHRQQLLQQQQLPGSPFSVDSDASSSYSVGGASPPCISQEHSTTEVVSRACSCASLSSTALGLSQEPSAADVGCSPAASALTSAAAAAAAGGGGGGGAAVGGQLSRQLGSGCFAPRQQAVSFRLRGGPLDPRSEPSQQLPEQQRLLDTLQTQQLQGVSGQRQQQQAVSNQYSSQEQWQQQLLQDPACQDGLETANACASNLENHTNSRDCSCRAVPAGVLPPQPPLEQHQDVCCAGSSADARAACRACGSPGPAAASTSSATSAEAAAPPCSHGKAASMYPITTEPGPEQQQQGGLQLPPRPSQEQQQQSSSSRKPVPKAQPGEKEPVGKPLFVPILVYMDEADHALMAEEALSHLGCATGRVAAGSDCLSSAAAAAAAAAAGSSSSSTVAACSGPMTGGNLQQDAAGNGIGVVQQQQPCAVSTAEALRRMRLLQEYLCAYEAQGLPVVRVSYGAFGEALDKLHEYILQCIKVAMS